MNYKRAYLYLFNDYTNLLEKNVLSKDMRNAQVVAETLCTELDEQPLTELFAESNIEK